VFCSSKSTQWKQKIGRQFNRNKTENVMRDLNLKGNINTLKGKLKQKYGDLTDNDLAYVEGKDDEFIGNLQKKLGKTKEEIAGELRKWMEE
jgi:uncharacterized protein YjbJ (UPF0337 family)